MRVKARVLRSFSPTPALAASHGSCSICGCTDVLLDQVQDGAKRLELGECPRCDHRWTRSLGGVLRVARPPLDALPHAA